MWNLNNLTKLVSDGAAGLVTAAADQAGLDASVLVRAGPD